MFDIIYPLTFDKDQEHSLVECRGEPCQLQISFRERWICWILRTLALESMHGWVSRNEFSRYRTMRFRLDRGRCTPLFTGRVQGVDTGRVGASENNRKAKYYSLTKTGQKQLQAELEDWGRISTAIALVLK